MSVHHLIHNNILARLRGPQPTPAPAQDDLGRSTAPDAPMNLLLRFETESGPRTVIAPSVPLKLASDIAAVMIQAGHFAEYVDHLPSQSVAVRIKRRKAEEAFTRVYGAPSETRPASTRPASRCRAG